ncbi:MAG: SLC13 family permease [Elusimicrobiota bacterium]
MTALFIGLSYQQILVVSIFFVSILGVMFFWEFRLSFLIIGSCLLFLVNSVDFESFIRFASLDVLLFIIGVMIVVGMMKETGVFKHITHYIMSMKNITGVKFFVFMNLLSALLSSVMGEVTSIMVIMMIIFDVCDTVEISPLPLIISCVFSTNIGSAATLFGNPIGILIALRGGISFEEFLTHALPVSVIILLIIVSFIGIFEKKYFRQFNRALAEKKASSGLTLRKPAALNIKEKASVLFFICMLISIALHRRMEIFFGLDENSLLIITPLFFAGIVLAYRHEKALYYIANEIEWPAILFFLFLFIEAGILQASGVAGHVSVKIIKIIGTDPLLLKGLVLFSSGLLSSVLDNTVVVASFIPAIQNLNLETTGGSLWWALLFGACFGGNITIIGSTANIVALGMLEKEKDIKISFTTWLKYGTIIGFISMILAFFALLLPGFK